jgi:tetratricopeptide (TPR) repeat protein
MKMVEQDTAKGEEYLKQIVALAPDNINALINLGDFYTGTKQYDKALAQFEQVKTVHKDSPAGYIKTANVYLKRNEDDKALSELKAGYEKFPDAAMLISQLSQLYMKNKNVPAAIALCEKRLENNPEEAFSWNLLGGIYFVTKAYDKAETHFEKAIEISPEWQKPYENLAQLYLVQGKKESAVARLESAIKQNEKNKEAWMLLGMIHKRDKDYQAAATVFKQAFDAIPSLWSAANDYAYITSEHLVEQSGDLSEAMAYAQKAVSLNGSAGPARDTLGWIYYKMGNYELAHDELKVALAQRPDHYIVNYHMGMVLEKQGRHQEAATHLESALAKNMDFPGADDARKIVEQYEEETGSIN